MTIRTGTLAVAISLVTTSAALAGNDYAFVDSNSNRHPLWSSEAQCNSDVYTEACVSFGGCSGVHFFTRESVRSIALGIYNSGGTVYVYYAGSSTLACSISQ